MKPSTPEESVKEMARRLSDELGEGGRWPDGFIAGHAAATEKLAPTLREVREKLEAIEKLGAREYEGEPAWNIQAVIVKEAIALLDAAIKGEKASPGKVGEDG